MHGVPFLQLINAGREEINLSQWLAWIHNFIHK